MKSNYIKVKRGELIFYVPLLDKTEEFIMKAPYHEILRRSDFVISLESGNLVKCRYPIEEVIDKYISIPKTKQRLMQDIAEATYHE